MFQTDLQWCVWVSQAGFGHSLKMCKREQAWLACVPVLLWHFLEMPGSCTERILEDWWELQGTCGYASAASATGAWDCLLTSLPVLRRLFLGKDGMCALYWSGWRALSTYWETWIALGQNSAHLVVYIVGIPGRAESLSCPLSEHLFLCMKSSFACLFFFFHLKPLLPKSYSLEHQKCEWQQRFCQVILGVLFCRKVTVGRSTGVYTCVGQNCERLWDVSWAVFELFEAEW